MREDARPYVDGPIPSVSLCSPKLSFVAANTLLADSLTEIQEYCFKYDIFAACERKLKESGIMLSGR
jgi:hypothetical protein